MKSLKAFFNDESGATMVEYALIVALIAVAVAVTLLFVNEQLNSTFTDIAQCIQEPNATNCVVGD